VKVAGIDATLFDHPFRVYRLGYFLTGTDGQRCVIGDVDNEDPRGYTVSDDLSGFLASLDPSRAIRCETVAEKGIYAALVQSGLVVVEDALSNVADSEVLIVLRRPVSLQTTNRGNYLLRSGDGNDITLSPIQLLWLYNNSASTPRMMGEVSRVTKKQMWDDQEDFSQLVREANKRGLTPDGYFDDQVLALVSSLTLSTLATVEKVSTS